MILLAIVSALVGMLIGGFIVNRIYESCGYELSTEIAGETFKYNTKDSPFKDTEIYENVTVVISESVQNKGCFDVSWYRQDNTKKLTEQEWAEKQTVAYIADLIEKDQEDKRNVK